MQMQIIKIAVAGFCLFSSVATPSKAAEPLTAEQQVVAMLTETAMFAANNCPGFYIVPGSIRAVADSAGVTEDQAMGEEWKKAMFLAYTYAEESYKKDSAGWCANIWNLAGPNFKTPILGKR